MKTNADTAPAIYIGLDVHKEQTTVAIADPGPDGECPAAIAARKSAKPDCMDGA